MQATLFGIILIPLCLLWLQKPVRLLQLALIASAFEASAALIIGGQFGVQPGMVAGLCLIGYVAAQYALGMRYSGEGVVFWTVTPLFLLAVYAVLSVFLFPQIFAGKVMVWPQRPDELTPTIVPLAFSSGNITQPLYLLLNFATTVAAALFLTRVTVPYQSILRAYLLGGYIVVGISFWQFASRVAGIPFPQSFLYSNPGWAVVDQAMGNVPRIQGPFSEPAALAFYLSGVLFCCLWLGMRGCRVMHSSLLLVLSLGAMLLSTSTTGFAVLLISILLLPAYAALSGQTRCAIRGAKAAAVIIVGAGFVAVLAVLLKPDLFQAFNTILDTTLAKGSSDSFVDRTALDAAALSTIGPTYGLGVGWGSFRPSSFLPGLVANGGIPGVILVLWFVFRVIYGTVRGNTYGTGHPAIMLASGFSAAVCGQLIAAVISAPTIGSLMFYLQLGCLIGATARMMIDKSFSNEISGYRVSGNVVPNWSRLQDYYR